MIFTKTRTTGGGLGFFGGKLMNSVMDLVSLWHQWNMDVMVFSFIYSFITY